MKTLPTLAFAGIAAAVAGTAIAASSNTHIMNVALPDGSTARVEYVGNVAPKVTVTPSPGVSDPWTAPVLPSFAGFGRMIEQMNRETQAMMRDVQQMAVQPGSGLNVASYGNLPAGADSVSVVSVSNGAGTCTRTTQVVSQGAGKPPKVTSNVSGDCAQSSPGSPGGKPAAARIDRT